MNAFEKWWLDGHGPHWKGYISQFEYDNCKEAWNAAIDAAIAACREVTEWDDHCTSGAKECDTLIQKLRSE